MHFIASTDTVSRPFFVSRSDQEGWRRPRTCPPRVQGELTQKLRPDGIVMSKEKGRRYILDRGGTHRPDPALVETEERGLIRAHLALARSEHLIF